MFRCPMKSLFLLLAFCAQSLYATDDDDEVLEGRLKNPVYSPFNGVLQSQDLLYKILDFSSSSSVLAASKCFIETFSLLDPASDLEKIGYPRFRNVLTSELLKHYWLRDFINGRLSEALVKGSILTLESPEMVEFAVRVVLGNPYKSNSEKKKYFTWLFECLCEQRRFSALERLIQVVPANLLDKKFSPPLRRLYFLHKLERINSDDTDGLLAAWNSVLPTQNSFTANISAPVARWTDIRAQVQDFHAPRAIQESYDILFAQCTSEQTANIRALSSELLARFGMLGLAGEGSRNLAFARLLDSIRFPTGTEDEMISNISDFFEKFKPSLYEPDIKHLVNATMCLNRPNLFKAVWDKCGFDLMTHILKSVNRRLSNVGCLKVAEYDNDGEFSALKYCVQLGDGKDGIESEKIQRINDISFRLAIIALTQTFKAFEDAVAHAAQTEAPDYFAGTISILIGECANPVPLINIILPQIRGLNLYWINKILGHEKYLCALFSKATNEHDRRVALKEMERLEIYPDVNVEFVYSLLTNKELATEVGSESNRDIVARLCISWDMVLEKYPLSMPQLLHIFQVLHAPIVDLSFSTPIYPDCMKQFRGLFWTKRPMGEIAEHARKSGVLPYFIIDIAWLDILYGSFRDSAEHGAPNPFLLRSFHLFAWWLHCNRDNFEAYAPPSVIRAFLPRAPRQQIPNPLLPESVALFNEWRSDDVFWKHAPESVRGFLASYQQSRAPGGYPLTNFDPFDQWRGVSHYAFVSKAPPQAVRAMDTSRGIMDIILCPLRQYNSSKEAARLRLRELLENQELFFYIHNQVELDGLRQEVTQYTDILQEWNCCIILLPSFSMW